MVRITVCLGHSQCCKMNIKISIIVCFLVMGEENMTLKFSWQGEGSISKLQQMLHAIMHALPTRATCSSDRERGYTGLSLQLHNISGFTQQLEFSGTTQCQL